MDDWEQVSSEPSQTSNVECAVIDDDETALSEPWIACVTESDLTAPHPDHPLRKALRKIRDDCVKQLEDTSFATHLTKIEGEYGQWQAAVQARPGKQLASAPSQS